MAEVFVSYRTADARYPAAYLADRLGKDFGPGRVFRDTDALVPGLPWPDGLDRALADARVLVVLIGPGWLDAPGPDGSGRALDRPDDWVRREIRTALTRPVVPVLLDDTARPAVSDLPAELASLAGLQTLRIRHDRLEADVDWLASVLARHVPVLRPVHTVAPVARRGFGRPVPILAATGTVLAIAALLVWMSLPTYTVGSVPVPDDATSMRLSRDGATGYVVHSDAGRISVIDLDSRAIVRTIDGVGSGALAVAITPDQRTAYVTHISSPQVSVVTSIPTADDPRDSPVAVAVTPDGSRAYATNRGAGTVAVVDTQRNTLIRQIDVQEGPNGVAVTPDGSHLYVTNEGSGTVSIVNLIDGSVVVIPVGSAPITVAVTPDGHRALVVARGSTSLAVLNTATKEVVYTVDLGHDPGSISVAPDGRTAYVTAGKANLVLTVTL